MEQKKLNSPEIERKKIEKLENPYLQNWKKIQKVEKLAKIFEYLLRIFQKMKTNLKFWMSKYLEKNLIISRNRRKKSENLKYWAIEQLNYLFGNQLKLN